MPLGSEQPCGGGDGAGMAVASPVFDDARPIAQRQPARGEIDGDDDEAREPFDGGKRRQHVFEHRQGQRLARVGRQQWSEPFLGPVAFLDRDDRPQIHHQKPRPAVSTTRASASRSAMVSINVRVAVTGTSRPVTAPASASSIM